MMSNKRGINFVESLGLAFIVLKLCDVILWSWWLVLLPLYGSMLFDVLADLALKEKEKREKLAKRMEK